MSTFKEQEEEKKITYSGKREQEEEKQKLEIYIPKPDPKPKTEPKKKINVIPTIRYQFWEENTKNYEKNSFFSMRQQARTSNLMNLITATQNLIRQARLNGQYGQNRKSLTQIKKLKSIYTHKERYLKFHDLVQSCLSLNNSLAYGTGTPPLQILPVSC